MYPLDVVKTRVYVLPISTAPSATDKSLRQIQTGKGVGEEYYNGMVDCFRKIVRNEGYGLPRTTAPRLL